MVDSATSHIKPTKIVSIKEYTMIDLYTFGTPNGQKASIMLEEVGLPYRVHRVSIFDGENKYPEFVAINPNGKIPAIVDGDGPGGKPLNVFESGAILIYLAEKTHSALLPSEPAARSATLQWLMWQMSALGPMFGQAGYFGRFSKEKIPPAIERFTTEGNRLLAVLNRQLAQNEFAAGNDYSIADIAMWPWIAGAEFIGLPLSQYSNIGRWAAVVGSRAAVAKGNLVGQAT
jgi:GSH-dependent disulfide-bond oxidoreductase